MTMNLHINLYFVKSIITNGKHLTAKQHFSTPQIKSSSLNKHTEKNSLGGLQPRNIVLPEK